VALRPASDRAGQGRARPGRGLVRAAIYSQVMVIPFLIEMLFLPADRYGPFKSTPAGSVVALVWVLLFVTMRRRNGWATVHDLISRTRVVTRPKHLARPGLAPAAETVASTEGAAQVGPYHVLETLPGPEGETVLLGYDSRLMRKVWIRQVLGGTPPVSTELRTWAVREDCGGSSAAARARPRGTPTRLPPANRSSNC